LGFGTENLQKAAELFESSADFFRSGAPQELGRVEHWNYAAFYPSASWVKPLFAGDELLPDFIARFHDLQKKIPPSCSAPASR
jgi:hypothetical protein